MPRYVKYENGEPLKIATEAELLEFCNSVRVAGGAGILEALLPSVKSDAKACLIARGVNFDCDVAGPEDEAWLDVAGGWPVWVMRVHYGNWEESQGKAKEIATKLELRRAANEIELPEIIGNSATAFDHGLAFTRYALKRGQEYEQD